MPGVLRLLPGADLPSEGRCPGPGGILLRLFGATVGLEGLKMANRRRPKREVRMMNLQLQRKSLGMLRMLFVLAAFSIEFRVVAA